MKAYLKKQLKILVPITFGIVTIAAFSSCHFGSRESSIDSHEQDEHHEEEFERGPKGGRLLRDGIFSLEVTIFEQGTDPRFRVYVYKNGKQIPSDEVKSTIILARLGEEKEVFDMQPEKAYLSNPKVVKEPHSFDVTVTASFSGKNSNWTFSSYEGRTEISEQALAEVGVVVGKAGSATLSEWIDVTGKIHPNGDRLQKITPRYSGIVKDMKKRLGENVQKGEVLAVVESNASLSLYEIRSEFQGTILSKTATVGSYVSENEVIYTIADLSTVWADFSVFRSDFSRLRQGQQILINFEDGGEVIKSQLSYLSAVGMENTQAFTVRAELPNPQRMILPGLFVHGKIKVSEKKVPLAVKTSAIQTFRDWEVVFAKFGNTFEIRPVQLGQRDEEWVEIVDGLSAGSDYVEQNSFLIKADILKSGASHDH